LVPSDHCPTGFNVPVFATLARQSQEEQWPNTKKNVNACAYNVKHVEMGQTGKDKFLLHLQQSSTIEEFSFETTTQKVSSNEGAQKLPAFLITAVHNCRHNEKQQ